MSCEKMNIYEDLTYLCRVCRRDMPSAGKLRGIFESERLPKIIYSVTHFEVKNVEGLPKFICDKCLDMLKKFSQFQVKLLRSEEFYKNFLEKRKTAHMDQLQEFARGIEMERNEKNMQFKNVIKKYKKKDGKYKEQTMYYKVSPDKDA